MEKLIKTIAVVADGVRTVHITAATGDYATLCGMDGDDPTVGQFPSKVVRGEKIGCSTCREIWETCRRVKPGDFVAE